MWGQTHASTQGFVTPPLTYLIWSKLGEAICAEHGKFLAKLVMSPLLRGSDWGCVSGTWQGTADSGRRGQPQPAGVRRGLPVFDHCR